MKQVNRWLGTWGYVFTVAAGAGGGWADGSNNHKRLVGMATGLVVTWLCWTVRETWRWMGEVDAKEKR